jgi:hypothetical protein
MATIATHLTPVGLAGTAVRPLCVIPCASQRLLTLKNFDLVIERDRLVSSRGPRMRELYADAELDRLVYGPAAGVAETQERMLARGHARAAVLAGMSDADVLGTDPGNRVVRVCAIRCATARRRLRIWTLRCELHDGTVMRWHWLARQGPPEQVLPALERALGDRLTTS